MVSTDRKEVFVPIIEKNFSKEMHDNINFYHLRGGIDYKKLGIIDKIMMAVLKIVISKKSFDELSDDDRELLATYGKRVDFTEKKCDSTFVVGFRNITFHQGSTRYYDILIILSKHVESCVFLSKN